MDWRHVWAAVLTELKYCLRHTISCLLAQQWLAARLQVTTLQCSHMGSVFCTLPRVAFARLESPM